MELREAESEDPARRLESWGWDTDWTAAWTATPRAPEDRPARIVEEHRDRYEVVAESAPAPAVLAPGCPRAAVGDWVALREGGPRDAAWIVDVLPRRTAFTRSAAGGESREQVLAANVDTVWIVHGLDQELNPRRLERYLTLGWESGATPVVVLTKADLADDPDEARRAAAGVALGIAVRVVSVVGDAGVGELTPDLQPGRSVALLGPSGAGKSTLVNALLGREELATAEVRPGDAKGRHTTTHRQLVRLEGGALLLDTPGMRELRLSAVDEGLQRTFPEIDALAEGCRYRDCAHDTEPGCAVRAAVEAGRLDADRLASWRKLQAEAAWQARRADPRAQQEETRRIKSIMKSLRFHPKYRDE